jgi:hypothetical protein
MLHAGSKSGEQKEEKEQMTKCNCGYDIPQAPWACSECGMSTGSQKKRGTLANDVKRPLATIARDIIADWKNPYFGAVPYIRALASCGEITELYGHDQVSGIVRYFLANAKTWRGLVAKAVKAELNALLKRK